MEPILTYSEITGRAYIVTKYRRLDGGVIDTREKFDVTRWVESYAKKRNAQIVEENAKLRELAGALLTSHEKMCTQRGHCFGCTFFYEEVKACPYMKISRTLHELGIEVD